MNNLNFVVEPKRKVPVVRDVDVVVVGSGVSGTFSALAAAHHRDCCRPGGKTGRCSQIAGRQGPAEDAPRGWLLSGRYGEIKGTGFVEEEDCL